MRARTIRRSMGQEPGLTACAAVLLLAAASAFGPLAWSIGQDLARAALSDPAALVAAGALDHAARAMLVRSVATAAGIGALAALLAVPAGRVLASGRGRATGLLVAPALVPAYLCYAGYGLARAPGTLLGDALARAAERGARWAPVLAGQALAVAGLALWAVPIAALVLAAAWRERDPGLADAARLEPVSAAARAALWWAGAWRPLAAAAGVVGLLMLGSALPLHLAQLETLSIGLWRSLAESGPGEWWRVWAAAWPLALGAALAAAVVSAAALRPLARSSGSGLRARTDRPARWVLTAALAIAASGTLAPLMLFVSQILSLRSVGLWWRVSGEGALANASQAAAIAAAAAITAAATAALAGHASRAARGLLAVVLGATLFAALLPGVLVGAAVARASLPDAIAVPAALWARAAFVPVLLGVFAAASEPPERRALRRTDGGGALRSWAGATLPGQWGSIAAAALAAGVLSFHEIESRVLVQPPGTRSLGLDLLAALHFWRAEELCVGAAVVTAVSLLLALPAAALPARRTT